MLYSVVLHVKNAPWSQPVGGQLPTYILTSLRTILAQLQNMDASVYTINLTKCAGRLCRQHESKNQFYNCCNHSRTLAHDQEAGSVPGDVTES